VKYSKDENPGYGLLGLAHGAPDPGRVSVADVDVALHGQSQGQPLEKMLFVVIEICYFITYLYSK